MDHLPLAVDGWGAGDNKKSLLRSTNPRTTIAKIKLKIEVKCLENEALSLLNLKVARSGVFFKVFLLPCVPRYAKKSSEAKNSLSLVK